MAEEGFLKRWSRRKIDARHGEAVPPEPDGEPAPASDVAPASTPVDADAVAPAAGHARGVAAEAPPPTMADVALLTPESDFSAFVRQDVAADVRRTALKKLFADPHFNTMDRLDVYIDDYNKPSPMSEAMLASLRHARSVFRHLTEDDEAEQRQPVAQPGSQAEAETQPYQQPPETETR